MASQDARRRCHGLGAWLALAVTACIAAQAHARALRRHRGWQRLRGAGGEGPQLVAHTRGNSSSRFKILQLTDLHFGEDLNGTWGPEQDRRSLAVMEAVLDAEHPDLVVFTGDSITGEDVLSAEDRVALRHRLLAPLKSRGVPWAVVLGNHDACEMSGCGAVPVAVPGGNGTALQGLFSQWARHSVVDAAFRPRRGERGGFVAARDRSAWQEDAVGSGELRHEAFATDLSQNLSRTGADGFFVSAGGGLSNYRLKVFASDADEEADRPSFILWFLDTGGGSMSESIAEDQVSWMLEESADLDRRHGPLPGALYMHVPLPEFAHMDPSSESCSGVSDDMVTPLADDHNLMSVLGRLHIGWVFTGHNHGNDWCCRITVAAPTTSLLLNETSFTTADNSIQLCYGRHSGYGGYSTPGMHERGARIFEFNPATARRHLLRQDSAAGVATWVRLEDGTAVARSPWRPPGWAGYHW